MCNTWGQLISKRWGGETETKCSQILVLSLRVQCYLISSRCFIILFLHLKLSLCVFVSFPFNPHFLLGALLSPALWPSSTNISCPSTGSLNFNKFFLQILTLLSPQSPPIAIHHNVPAPSIRYGYWSPDLLDHLDHLDDQLVEHLEGLDDHTVTHLDQTAHPFTLSGKRCWTWIAKRDNDVQTKLPEHPTISDF